MSFAGLVGLGVFPLNRATGFTLPWLSMFCMPGPQYLLGLVLVGLFGMFGRRRVGKSFLLSRFARATDGVHFQATRRTESEQLEGLSRVVGERFADAALVGGAALPS